MNIPGPVPMKLFWSATVYDAETRCLIETPLMRAAVRSHLDKPVANSDGSYDITFGPKNPGVPESNWVQTLPGSGWKVTVRLYGPIEDVFKGTWKLGDLKRVKWGPLTQRDPVPLDYSGVNSCHLPVQKN